jgi:hypothetical protein
MLNLTIAFSKNLKALTTHRGKRGYAERQNEFRSDLFDGAVFSQRRVHNFDVTEMSTYDSLIAASSARYVGANSHVKLSSVI